MAAPAGNQFWKQRSKHGRDLIFGSPTILWEAACEYFDWAVENPLIEIDHKLIGVKIVEVEIPHPRPFTMIGLSHFCHVNEVYFNQLELRFAKQTGETAEDFAKVIKQIREVVFNQKFEGAAVGFYKENLIAYDLGLKQRVDLTTNDKDLQQNVLPPNLTYEQLQQLANGNPDTNTESGKD